MELSRLLGRRIKEIRESKGLTQQQLAELCDMHTTSIGMIEIGKRSPLLGTVELLAKKLDVEYVDLFDFGKVYHLDESKDKLKIDLARAVSDFNPKQLKHMINHAKAIRDLCDKNTN